jgi:predicted O-linked N-acetylglucosamine transferase (SPINDLY family)
LSKKIITLGCFQNLHKINDEVLAVWSRVFQHLPNARLLLQAHLLKFPEVRNRLLKRLDGSGIDTERVTLEKAVPRRDYLTAHSHIDMILDTFPFTGGTTTCEALWMGVPTVTLIGNTMIARQGASLLTAAGLPDWIAKDTDDYVAKAVAYASDLEKLAQLRAGLRQHVLSSPLFDGQRFARNFEAALWKIWQRYLMKNGKTKTLVS